jgi:hypothetical protein
MTAAVETGFVDAFVGREKAPASGPRLVTGEDLLEQGNEVDVNDVLDDLLLEADECREDIIKFFDFVARDETTRRRVQCAPHQKVMLEFLVAHNRPVVMAPVGHAKTFCLVILTLWMLGNNPSLRGAVISATQQQSEKVVGMVRDYIESSEELHLVFPNLRKSMRAGDHWTQTNLVVDRPPGIRDPSLVAVGLDGAIMGSRLNWVIVDDLLNAENTRTPDSRLKVHRWIDAALRSRLDPMGEKLVFSNTPWHPDDIVMTLHKQGWSTLRMDANGSVFVQDDVERVRQAEEDGVEFVPWDSQHLVPASDHPSDTVCRLAAHQPDPEHRQTLWPERLNRRQLDKVRRSMEVHAFNQSYLTLCRDNDSAWCRTEWIDAAKKMARDKGVFGLVGHYKGSGQAFTGVDLAFSDKAKSDDTAFFTFATLPSGHRMILDIEIGKWNSPTVARKIVDKHRRYNSIVVVEDVGAQKGVLQLIKDIATGIPIKGFTTTGSKKASVENGLPVIFSEIEQGLWLIPCDRNGQCSAHVQKWIDGLLAYQPSNHTADSLMAMFFARYQAWKYGALGGGVGNLGEADLDFTTR